MQDVETPKSEVCNTLKEECKRSYAAYGPILQVC